MQSWVRRRLKDLAEAGRLGRRIPADIRAETARETANAGSAETSPPDPSASRVTDARD